MLYQLPNGKCIEISIEQYLRMTDDELTMYVAFNYGEEINDPFALSVLKYGNVTEKEEIIDEDSITVEEEYIEDLTDVLPEEKLYDDEYIDYDNLEQ
jgi:hypothetical protein